MADPQQPKNPERLELEDLTTLQPGLARLMPEIGDRYWKCYYAAVARNWPFAAWQLRELRKLMRLGMMTRPKYTSDLEEWIADSLEPLQSAVEAQDLERFRRLYHDAVDSANEFHRRWKKQWIVWKLPEMPPSDLDLTPRD
ncbi:MAG: hypothetical protein ABR498_09400 [Candidatus Dormibacteria bacterium]